jgi:hypothetical protein
MLIFLFFKSWEEIIQCLTSKLFQVITKLALQQLQKIIIIFIALAEQFTSNGTNRDSLMFIYIHMSFLTKCWVFDLIINWLCLSKWVRDCWLTSNVQFLSFGRMNPSGAIICTSGLLF